MLPAPAVFDSLVIEAPNAPNVPIPSAAIRAADATAAGAAQPSVFLVVAGDKALALSI